MIKVDKTRLNTLNRRCIFLLLICSVWSGGLLASQTKVALLIGNSAYQDSPLTNPKNDAQDMGSTLERLGFAVSVYTDLDRKKMREVIRTFGDKLKKHDVGLFYFAGHGVQIKGRNYLVPVSSDIHSADEVEDESIDAGSVLRKMETAGNAVNIVILDACRNNPFARSFRNMEQGLARMDGPVGSFIAYATAPGSVAADGKGRNGVYTQHLLTVLQQPGLTIEQTFKQVRNGVRQDTQGQQIPWESSSLTGEFAFLTSEKAAKKMTSIPPPTVAKKYLQVIGNVPNANIKVNDQFRGQLDSSGVLNLANLLSDKVEVSIEAPGYAPEKHTVELSAGRWQQLNVHLKPSRISTRQDQKSKKTHTAKRSKNCLPGKRAILVVRSEYSPLNKKSRVKMNAPKISALLHNSFRQYDLEFINVDTVINQRMYDRMSNESVSFYQGLAKRLNIDYAIRVAVVAAEAPIKVVSTSMKTINGDITLALIDLKTGLILSETSGAFTKAGINMLSLVNQNVQHQVMDLVENLLTEACSR